METYVQYKLKILNNISEDEKIEIILNLRKKFDVAMTGLDEEGDIQESIYWPTISNDMCEFSKQYEDIVFEFTCHDEYGDYYRIYFMNGDFQYVNSKITVTYDKPFKKFLLNDES